MASLYELTEQARQLQEMFLDGEIDEETLKDTLESLDIKTKVENVCKVIRNLTAEAEALKAEEKRMADRRKACENGVSRLKESLVTHLSISGIEKATAGVFKVSLGHSKSVCITDDKKLPLDYFIPQPDKIDKKAITEALKAGADVPGAEFQESMFVTIR